MWEILVSNAPVGSIILYGLEPLQLTDADYKRLGALQQRGLRRMLGILAPHLDRTDTNQCALGAARKEAMTRRRLQGTHMS